MIEAEIRVRNSTERVNALPLLARCAFFEGLDTAAMGEILAAARYCTAEADEMLFYQDDAAEWFYVILSGHLRLTQLTAAGDQVTLRYAGPGDGVGIIVALSDTVYPLSAVAVQHCELLRWGRAAVVELMLRYPLLALNGIRLISNQFVALQNRYRELSTECVERRIARALLRLARQTGKQTAAGILIDLPLSRQDLAEMTGTTLYTVSRTLKRWEQGGLVLSAREQVTICQPHGLVLIAEDLPGQPQLGENSLR